jgi:hypothetical protein
MKNPAVWIRAIWNKPDIIEMNIQTKKYAKNT